ncbi:helix-turn-helix domain-containing protein [Pyxidicoccus sp. QH1ED-7-1]|nr:helix-turn-helix domain-containing protein [Pyxidicoccus xibeiensis]
MPALAVPEDAEVGAASTLDRAAVEAALASQGGNVSAAARVLGLHRTQMYRLMRHWGLGPASEE